jgi:tripartite-type tricarboxylate transporter receptor subunit TctC
LWLGYGCAAAQSYPAKPVRLILPLAAGTGTDRMTRVLAQKMSEDLGQQVVVENRPGAGATIGTEAAARSAPDGYTLYMGGSVALTITPALFKTVPYDPAKDFSAVALLSRSYLILSVHPSLPAKDVKGLIALARSRPNELVLASGGTGTTSQLTGAMLGSMANIKLLHVPYKGGGDSLVAIMSGEAQLAFTPVSLGMVQGKAGKLRSLGVSSLKRVASLPQVPAIAETIPGFEWSGWQVLMAPAATPKPVLDRLYAATRKATGSAEFRDYLAREGSEPFDTPPSAFPKFLAAEMEKNAKLVKIAGARVD